MYKSLIFAAVAISFLFIFACKKKEKQGYEKVIYNKYQGHNTLFHFYSSDSCEYMTIRNDGTVDSNNYFPSKYIVKGDSIFIDNRVYKGVIKSDRLILQGVAPTQILEYFKLD